MKFLKRFNESKENVVDELIDYLSNNLILYIDNYILSNSDARKEIGINNTMNKLYLELGTKKIEIYVDYSTMCSIVNEFNRGNMFFKDLSIPSVLCDNTYLEHLYLRVNNNLVSIDESKQKLIYFRILQKLKNLSKILTLIRRNSVNNQFTTSEWIERFQEFEITKGNRIDLISLNSLFDYYDMKFEEKIIKDYLSKSDILYQ